MANISIPGLPSKTGTILDTGYLHLNESSVDKKVTITQLLTKISGQYSADIATFLGSANNAEARTNLGIARITTVSDANYIILVTDKVVAQIGTMSAARTFSLPAAADMDDGEELIIIDESGTVSPANKITIQRAGTDTIDGDTEIEITQKYGVVKLVADGSDSWKITTTSSPKLMELFKNRNKIINGDFNIWQRGSSFTAVSNGDYTADRYKHELSLGTGVYDASRSTDVPTVAQAGRLFNYSHLIDCTTAEAAIAAGEYSIFSQIVEGFNFLPIAQKKITLSFWVKATKTGTYCVSFRNAGFDRSYVAEYTVDTTDTWEFKVITIDTSPSAGTWNYLNGVGLRVGFTLVGGSTFQTTAGSWQTGDYFSTSNQVNGLDNTANDFRLCGIQLEEGEIHTPFEDISFQESLEKCQRYFEKNYNLETAPGSVASTGYITERSDGGNINTNVPFRVLKRNTPSVTNYNPVTGTAGEGRNYSAASNTALGAFDIGFTGYSISKAITDTQMLGWNFAADAEL